MAHLFWGASFSTKTALTSSPLLSWNPADVFAMALATTEGDVPLAMLVAHNLLKEAAYAKCSKVSMSLGNTGMMVGVKAKKLFGAKNLNVYARG